MASAPRSVRDEDGVVAAGDDRPSWSDIAGWYDDLLTAGSGPHETALECLRSLLPDLRGATVLDLACGQGLATRALAAAGAEHVIGTDRSEAMIELARRHGGPVGGTDITYVVDDAQTLQTFEDSAFDGVTCQLALMDIPDLDAALGATRRVLRQDGWFVFVIGHPCYLVPDAATIRGPDGRPAVTITNYFGERFWRSTNPDGVRRAGNYHRTLSTYLNGLIRAGFALDVVAEPKPSRRLAEQRPLYEQVPIFFAGRAIRRG
jgi:SAM-dependent methyltransferase